MVLAGPVSAEDSSALTEDVIDRGRDSPRTGRINDKLLSRLFRDQFSETFMVSSCCLH